MPNLSLRARKVHQKLLQVYGNPIWRNPLPPIDELVSTILSQNTNDLNRDRAFRALRDEFPTWEAVRDARRSRVIRAIRSAGLANQKGPRIQQVLRQITAERGSLDLRGQFGRVAPPRRRDAATTSGAYFSAQRSYRRSTLLCTQVFNGLVSSLALLELGAGLSGTQSRVRLAAGWLARHEVAEWLSVVVLP